MSLSRIKLASIALRSTTVDPSGVAARFLVLEQPRSEGIATERRRTEARATKARTLGSAAHLAHQAHNLAHQTLHLGGLLALLKSGLEGVLRLARTKVASQCIALRSLRSSKRAESAATATASASLSESTLRPGKRLGALIGAKAARERHRDADRGSLILWLIDSVNSTHWNNPHFQVVLK